MTQRQLDALLLVMLTACSSTHRNVPAEASSQEIVIQAHATADVEPVKIDEKSFASAIKELTQDFKPSKYPRYVAQRLLLDDYERNHYDAVVIQVSGTGFVEEEPATFIGKQRGGHN